MANTIRRRLKWKYDVYYQRRRVIAKDLSVIENKNIVILAPHSDDEWVGCSQLLISPKCSITIINMDMPGGDDMALHNRRYLEMESVAHKHKIQLLTISKNKKEFLKKYLEENNVDIVFIPSFFDWHEEHIFVMKLFDSVANDMGYDNLVAMYQVSLPIPELYITHCSVMTKSELKEKWNNLYKYYPTQNKLPVKRFLANERINGAIINRYAIEAYAVMTFKKWSSELKRYSLNDIERQDLYFCIQDISLVRRMLKDLVDNKK